MGVVTFDIISNSLHIHYFYQHILGISYIWLKKKNVNISMGVSLLEKNNWYY